MLLKTMDRNQHTTLKHHAHPLPRDKINPHAIAVIETLVAKGYQAYLVGGSVRDLLLGASPKDFDVATNADPDEVRQLFRNSRIIGRRFRLVHVFYPREIIEVATFRANPHPNALPASAMLTRDNVYGNIEEDVFRRDFQINALYYDIKKEEIIDYVDGYEAIQQKIIKTIGKPESRFMEDPVRMLRALRFSAKLDFEIEASNRAAITEHRLLILQSSAARLFDELIKMLYCGNGYRAFELLREYHLLELLLPSVAEYLEEQNEKFLKFVQIALNNTDNRLKQGLSLNPAFILAVFFWGPLQKKIAAMKKGRFMGRYRNAYDQIFNRHVRTLEIPRRLTDMMQEIWLMQYKLEKHHPLEVDELLTQPRFRAAYDFLLLRAEIGSKGLKDAAQWWTEFINKIREESSVK